jgi:hypothetical protein
MKKPFPQEYEEKDFLAVARDGKINIAAMNKILKNTIEEIQKLDTAQKATDC